MQKKAKLKIPTIFFNKKYIDKRGYFKELLKKNNLKYNFPFTVMSCSKKNVLRGLHIQLIKPQGKFISVLKGKIYDVAVDLRKNSKTFGKYFSYVLSEKNSKSLFIPPGFAHGFVALDNINYVVYSCTEYRYPRHEISLKFDDKDLRIKWPIKKPIISSKDNKAISLTKFKEKFYEI